MHIHRSAIMTNLSNMSISNNLNTTGYHMNTDKDVSNSSMQLNYDVPHSIMVVDMILERVLLPITCSGGIIGTVLTILVLSRKKMCTSTNLYLKSLAITDLIFLILLLIRTCEHLFEEASYTVYNLVHIVLDYLQIFFTMFDVVSIWLTVVLSIERYIAICYPLHAVRLSTAFRARLAILFIYVTAFLCVLPKFWEIKVMNVPQYGIYIAPADLIDNTEYILGYRIFLEGILSVFLPFLFLITINTRLIQAIHKSNRYLSHNLSADSVVRHVISAEQVQLTLMLVGITVIFFLCHAPFLIYTAISATSKYQINADEDTHIAFLIFRPVSLLLLGVKSAINFILYCWISEKFRITFMKMFCLKRCLTEQQMRRLSNNSHYNARSRETTC